MALRSEIHTAYTAHCRKKHDVIHKTGNTPRTLAVDETRPTLAIKRLPLSCAAAGTSPIRNY